MTKLGPVSPNHRPEGMTSRQFDYLNKTSPRLLWALIERDQRGHLMHNPEGILKRTQDGTAAFRQRYRRGAKCQCCGAVTVKGELVCFWVNGDMSGRIVKRHNTSGPIDVNADRRFGHAVCRLAEVDAARQPIERRRRTVPAPAVAKLERERGPVPAEPTPFHGWQDWTERRSTPGQLAGIRRRQRAMSDG